MNLNKGISTPIAILLIIAVSAVVGVLVWQYKDIGSTELKPTTPSKSITLTSPKEGERWILGKLNDITWRTTNFDSNERVKIILLEDDTSKGVIATTSNTGSYTWDMEADLEAKFESIGGNLKIKICSVKNQEVCDKSNEIRILESMDEPPSRWPSYKNDKYNYRIQYPFQAEVTKESEDEVRINLPLSTDTRCGGKYLRIATEESTSQECSNPLEKDFVENKGTIEINGIEFKKEIASNIDGSRYTVYSTLRNQRCISLIFALEYSIICKYPEDRACPPDCEVAKESEVFDQMISSFEFTN